MREIVNRLIYIIVGLALFLCGIALIDFLLHPLAGDRIFNSPLYRAIVILVLTPLTLLVGFLIVRRVPGNIVGPLLIVWGGSVAYGSLRADINTWLYALYYFYDMAFGWLALFLMLLHFPDGEIYPPRVTAWVYSALGLIVVLIPVIFLGTPVLLASPFIANPFYRSALAALEPYTLSITMLALFFFVPIMVLAMVSPVLRFRKGSPLERQQIKWLALFAGFSVLYTLVILVIYPLLTGGEIMNPGDQLPGMVFYISVGLFPPVVIGFAVMHYRLWEIDVIIRKTVVYSILTLVLTLIYIVSVVLLQSLVGAIGGQQSTVITVISTLVIAALFTPIRRRIQTVIDRRFYRRKYVGEQVLAEFSTTLRNEVDLDELKVSILEVVDGTMQPEHVSLWMLKTVGARREQPIWRLPVEE